MLSAIRKQIQLSSSLNSLARKTMSVENKFSLKKKFHNNRQVPTLFKNSTTDDYIRRHIGNKESDTQAIIKDLDLQSMNELMDQTVPDSIRLSKEEMFTHKHNKVFAIDSSNIILQHM